MCGICGKLFFDREATVSPATIGDMTRTMHHRGPDDEGFFVSGQIGLGFRRLSIIDLSGGRQPLSNEDGTVWVVFNGEIYNYQTLRDDLVEKGHIFKTRSDTEVLVHLYEECGSECVHKLRGMFAFAIWDGPRKSLLLARDRVGIKPLYYFVDHNGVAFASEMKALLADPCVPRHLDVGLVDRFLSHGYMPGPETLLKGVFKMKPGHTLLIRDGSCHLQRYWDLEFSMADRTEARKNEDELLELLDETVRLHMISDVPVGFLLSGGIDSTAMLSFAAQQTSKPISTFTVGFRSETVVDERPFARLAANAYGAKHYELSMSPADFASFVPRYVWHMEEPVCEPPAIALYYISRLASQFVRVLISGEGGDEAFAGYENYRNIFWFERLKAICGPLKGPLGVGMTLLGRQLNSRVITKYGMRMNRPFDEYYLSRTSSPFEFFPRERARLYTEEMAQRIDPDRSVSVAKGYLSRAGRCSVLNKMLYVDTNTWLPDELLIKADKMTMANSVELRVPLLDHKVLEFAARLPRKQKIHGSTMKYIAKRALSGRVPRPILARRKAGFPVPYGAWFRGELRPWVASVLLDGKTRNRGYFKQGVIEELINRNLEGGGYSKEIFSLLVLELWLQTFIDRCPVASPPDMSSRLSG